MASTKNFVSTNMTAYAAQVLAKARKEAYPSLRGLDEAPKLMVDDVVIPPELYPENISAWSYNYISMTTNNMYGETAIDLLINMRMKCNWTWEHADESTVRYWMGLINSRILVKKNRDFKVNLYMPGFGFIESIWNTGAPISGSAVSGSGHDGKVNAPGSSYYASNSLLTSEAVSVHNYSTDKNATSRWYGSHSSDDNIGSITYGVTDTSKFEIHWIEKKGLRLNKLTDLVVSDIIDNEDLV